MDSIGDFLKGLYLNESIPWYEWGLLVIFLFCCLLVVLTIAFTLYVAARFIFFKKIYGDIVKIGGVVSDKEYVPASYTYNAATKTTNRIPSEHNVSIKLDNNEEIGLDDKELFSNVKRREKLLVTIQNRYFRPRFWHGNIKEDGFIVLNVETSDKEVIVLRDEKPNTYLNEKNK